MFPHFLKRSNDRLPAQLGHILFEKEPAIKAPQGRFTDEAQRIVPYRRRAYYNKEQTDTAKMTEGHTHITN